MPRKYRPPTAKRRKSRRTNIPYESPGAAPEVDTEEEPLDEEAPLVAVDSTSDEEIEEAPRAQRGLDQPVRHVNRDYSYVRGEVVRIVALAGFLIIALAITAFFRN